MKFVVREKHICDIDLVGGKGHHLQKLVEWGAPVAPFIIVTTDSFKYFSQHRVLPDEVTIQLAHFLKLHPNIALRSSMISEDNIDSSFAGMFETLLDVNADNWQESLKKIFDSIHSDRVREYIKQKNIQVDLQMAVVAQELISVEKSGVLFTRSPLSPTSAVAIDAARGMGEGVVSGLVDVDHFLVTRNGDLISSKSHAEPVLNQNELLELMRLGLKLEHQLCAPSDIEWGMKDGKIYIFQIRPITRHFESLKVFVDTNLSESYPGTVSPFTANFVKKAYENVFTESAIIFGATGERLKLLKSHYRFLISSVDNHLYYNLEHYYAVLRALPGGDKNIDNWHKMIGGKIDGLTVPYHATKLSSFETVLALKTLFKLVFKRNTIFPKLLSELDLLQAEIKAKTLILKKPNDIIHYLNHLIERPLGFGFTIVNDVFVMIGLGLCTNLLKRKGLAEEKIIDLLKTEHDVDSIKPLESFNELVGELSEKFITTFSTLSLSPGIDPYRKAFDELTQQGFAKEVQIVESFIEKYGDRSFEELKLESLPLRNNPELLMQLIVWAKHNPSRVSFIRSEPLSLDTTWLEQKILNFTRDSIATREATRLWRGKFYQLLRQLVLNLSFELKQKPEWQNFSTLDFFSITHDEWLKYANGEISLLEVQKFIVERRIWQTNKKQYPEIITWVESEPLPEEANNHNDSSLSGQGVSHGITEGIALVLENPQDALVSEYQDFILVTRNTDPAWVYIMSRSKGLISEKGSLLSHTAIIGRELNIPTIVGVKGATHILKSGQKIKMDAMKGTIEIL